MNNKKILIAVLSLILLFTVSCDNENKTGGGNGGTGGIENGGSSGGGSSSGNDIDSQINALFDKFPKTTGNPVSDSSLNGNYNSQNKLTIDKNETETINNNETKEDLINRDIGKEISLEIKDGKVTCKSAPTHPETYLDGKQLYNSSGKYNAVEEKTTTFEEGGNDKRNYYIEFIKDSSGNLTSFKFMELTRVKAGEHNYAVQQTYTGTLIKGS